MLAVGLIFILAACGGGDSESEGNDTSSGNNESDSGDEVVIDFMHLWPEGSSKQHYEIVNEIIAEYEAENEGVTVKTEILGNEQYKEKIRY